MELVSIGDQILLSREPQDRVLLLCVVHELGFRSFDPQCDTSVIDNILQLQELELCSVESRGTRESSNFVIKTKWNATHVK